MTGIEWSDEERMSYKDSTINALRLEVARLRAELAEQKRVNLQLADRLAACSAVLGRAAERGRVCGCQQPDNGGEG